MGEDNWKNSAVWPPNGLTPTDLYFHKNGLLDNVIPANNSDTAKLIYDPKNPSPSIGGSTLRQDLLQGPYDQAPLVESRNDILKYTSVVLGSNVVMKGKGVVHLFVSSDMKDTDFAVRLTDVYPDNRSMILMDGIRRLRFRNGYNAADTALAVQDSIYQLTIELPDVCNTFLAGHRIRVDITSSNYPRFDCNLNNGGAMYVAGDTLIASNTLHLNSIHSSFIQLPLIDFTGGVNELLYNDNSALICPNPVSDEHFSILYNNKKSTSCMIEITDINGKLMQSKNKYTLVKGENNITLSTKNFANGLYFVKIYDNTNLLLSRKFVVSK